MTGPVPLDLDVLAAPEVPIEIARQRRLVDKRGKRGAQARFPVAFFVPPPSTAALKRLRAITMRCTSDGPS